MQEETVVLAWKFKCSKCARISAASRLNIGNPDIDNIGVFPRKHVGPNGETCDGSFMFGG